MKRIPRLFASNRTHKSALSEYFLRVLMHCFFSLIFSSSPFKLWRTKTPFPESASAEVAFVARRPVSIWLLTQLQSLFRLYVCCLCSGFITLIYLLLLFVDLSWSVLSIYGFHCCVAVSCLDDFSSLSTFLCAPLSCPFLFSRSVAVLMLS